MKYSNLKINRSMMKISGRDNREKLRDLIMKFLNLERMIQIKCGSTRVEGQSHIEIILIQFHS
jgi:hypothetical protein